jgi:ERCC4-type nuclease
MDIYEQQQFIIEGLPQISSVIAKRLLEHFGSIRALSNASEQELQEVPGVGKKIAQDIYQVINEQYQTH